MSKHIADGSLPAGCSNNNPIHEFGTPPRRILGYGCTDAPQTRVHIRSSELCFRIEWLKIKLPINFNAINHKPQSGSWQTKGRREKKTTARLQERPAIEQDSPELRHNTHKGARERLKRRGDNESAQAVSRQSWPQKWASTMKRCLHASSILYAPFVASSVCTSFPALRRRTCPVLTRLWRKSGATIDRATRRRSPCFRPTYC
jgi:hypothetical protein